MSSFITLGIDGCIGERLVLKSITLSVAFDEHGFFESDRKYRIILPDVFLDYFLLMHVLALLVTHLF